MNASSFQGENKLSTLSLPPGQVSALHSPLDTWNQSASCMVGLALIRYSHSAPHQQCQRQARRTFLLAPGSSHSPPKLQNKGHSFWSSPTFSRFFFPVLECPASPYANTQSPQASTISARGIPPSTWSLFPSFPSPKVDQKPLSSSCAGDLK